MTRLLILFALILLFNCCQTDTSYNGSFDADYPIINLNGTWKVNINPSGDFWKEDILSEDWKNIQVPGECMMQGFPIKHDKPFVYKKSINLPEDIQNRKVILQFDGVYSYSKVWINGNFVRDHSGGFTRWECDISPFVKAGQEAILTMEVTDKADEISYASGYAKHQIGGILRDVRLLILPHNYPKNISIETDLDKEFHNASLTVSGRTFEETMNARIELELFDIKDKKVHLKATKIKPNSDGTFQIINQIKNPAKWDAEHPNLYRLKISYFENRQILWQKEYKIGFREVEVFGNKLFLNGSEVKLRGANRHDIHPLLGRVSTPDYELKDVLIAKEANMNFIRTSHYPPTENFLKLCDEYGLYVESETAVCFVGSHRTEEYYPGASESDPAFTERYLSQLEEMVTNHKNHPSVIIWSIGNENSYGNNFAKSYKWVKANDGTRPIIYSYPGNVPDSLQCYNILSMHYPDISGNLSQYTIETRNFGYSQMPVIFDEWAHVACYNNFTLMEDPNIRDFWGRSLDIMWQKTFEADGGLGGAIWGMIDETFMLPANLPGYNEWWGKIDKNVIPAAYSGHTVGYGEWGIIDTWRRKKPEFWNTKKAYSPVKLLQTEIKNQTKGESISLPVYNRFDHTNLSELTINYLYKGKGNRLQSPNIEPHSKGELLIPVNDLEPDEPIILEFYTQDNNLIDKYMVNLKSNIDLVRNSRNQQRIEVIEDNNTVSVICENDTRIIFSKKTGLINKIKNSSGSFAFSGPFINLRTKGNAVMYSYHKINEYGKKWRLKHFNHELSDESISISIKGIYNNTIPVEYSLAINSIGEIKMEYQVEKVSQEYIRELGVKFILDDIIDTLSWERNSYWTFYPPDHLSAPKGKAALYSEHQKNYRTDPGKSWNLDAKSFYYDGIDNEKAYRRLTNIAKSTKQNIETYNIFQKGRPILSVKGKGDINCRIAKSGEKIILFANNEMDYVDLSWGNFQNNIMPNKIYSNEVLICINTIETIDSK